MQPHEQGGGEGSPCPVARSTGQDIASSRFAARHSGSRTVQNGKTLSTTITHLSVQRNWVRSLLGGEANPSTIQVPPPPFSNASR